MKICCLGDIHYHGSQYDLDKLAENIRDSCSSVDAVVVVGDITSSGRLDLVHDVLSTIRVGQLFLPCKSFKVFVGTLMFFCYDVCRT